MGLKEPEIFNMECTLCQLHSPLLYLEELVFVHPVAKGLGLGLAAQTPAVGLICVKQVVVM